MTPLPRHLAPVLCLLIPLVGSKYLQADSPVESKQWVVLVGVAKHDDQQINDLKYTLDDVRALREIVLRRGRTSSDNVLELSDNVDKKPTLTNLRGELPRFLARVGKDDRVLIHFSCHGFLDDVGTYLIRLQGAGAELGVG